MSRPTLIVLAAGLGSRYGGPKQIAPVGPQGETLVEYALYDALQAGFGAFVFVVSPGSEATFRQRLAGRLEQRCDIAYVQQRLDDLPPGRAVPSGRAKPWGTAHAVLSCRRLVRTPFAVANADDFYGRSAYQALCGHLQRARDGDGLGEACLVAYRLEHTLSEQGPVSRAVCTVDRHGYLVEIHECRGLERAGQVARYTESDGLWTEIPLATPVSMNMWGFTPGLFGELEARFAGFLRDPRNELRTAEFYLPDAIDGLLSEGRVTVRVLPAGERWFGVTYEQDLRGVQQRVRDLIGQGVYPRELWASIPSAQESWR